MRTVQYKILNEYARKRVELSKERSKRGQLRVKDWSDIANKVYKDEVKPLSWIQCRKVMNMPEVKKLSELRIVQLLDEYGLTENKSSELIEESIKIAKKQENAKLLLEQAKYLNELRGFAPNKTVITESRQYKGGDIEGISTIIDKEVESKRKITVSTTVNNIENEEKTRENT